MKKEMRYLVVFAIVLGFLLVFLSPVIADFELGQGNQSYDIEFVYGPSEPIKGWINISLQDESINSVLNAFDSNITIKEFLDENSAAYSCFPSDCKSAYSTVGSGTPLKIFSMGYLEQELIGIKLTNDVDNDGITGFTFDVSTNDLKSCQNPLKIDLLDDGIIEWKAEDVSDIYTCVILNPYGCYNEADVSEDPIEITSTSLFCEQIEIPVNRGLKIGAEVIGTGAAQFAMTISAEGYEESCTSSPSDGEIKCSIEFEQDLQESAQADVCISKISGAAYTIKYEDVEPCGYSLVDEEEFPHDFPIFVEVARYDNVDDFTFNQDLIDNGNTGIELANEIFNHVSIKYAGDCDSGCIIPIRIYSGVSPSQEITISNLKLNYTSKGLPKYESNIYDIQDSEVLIDSDFQKLYLEKANLLVPINIGSANLILKLDSRKILEQEIEIKAVPKIIDIIPHNVPALVSYPFVVLLEEQRDNLTYTWNFGDGSNETSNTNILKHAYSSLKNYDLTVVVGNEFGNSSKTVQITAGSPKDYINETIEDYREKLDSIESEINKLAGWVKEQIEKEIDVDKLKAQIDTQADKFDPVFSSDEENVAIMAALLELNVPNSFGTSQIISPSKIFPNSEQINLNALEDMGAGEAEAGAENYASSVTNWLKENLDISFESKTYALYYDERAEDLVSHIKVVLTPKQDLEDIYFLIDGAGSEIHFSGGYTIREYGEEAAGIVFSDLTEAKTIEFLYPGKIEIGNFPIYVSPELGDLELGAEPGICNFNKECEKELGETYKNCRTDCKPVGKTLIYLIGLFFVAFIVYIMLQEWYKKYYRSRLFKDKNQLFNLINFMSNSFNQGLRKSQVLDKLVNIGWEKEQLTFAWNKFQGKRVGMWEIPVFKWAEKRQVAKELEKRSNIPAIKGLSLK